MPILECDAKRSDIVIEERYILKRHISYLENAED